MMRKARLSSSGQRTKAHSGAASLFSSLSLSLSRVGVEGAHPEPQRPGERLHRGGAGPPGADLSIAPEGLLPRTGHQR